jgi:hypothetical protein
MGIGIVPLATPVLHEKLFRDDIVLVSQIRESAPSQLLAHHRRAVVGGDLGLFLFWFASALLLN